MNCGGGSQPTTTLLFSLLHTQSHPDSMPRRVSPAEECLQTIILFPPPHLSPTHRRLSHNQIFSNNASRTEHHLTVHGRDKRRRNMVNITCSLIELEQQVPSPTKSQPPLLTQQFMHCECNESSAPPTPISRQCLSRWMTGRGKLSLALFRPSRTI